MIERSVNKILISERFFLLMYNHPFTKILFPDL